MNAKHRTVICAIDFSDYTPFLIRWGILLAEKSHSRLIVAHAIHNPTDPFHSTPVLNDREYLQHTEKQEIERMTSLVREEGTTWEPVVLWGDPVTSIPDFALSRNVHMVIAGSRGISGLKRLFTGTVIERMARTLKVPLLVVRSSSRPDEVSVNDKPQVTRIGVCCDFSRHTEYLVTFAGALCTLLNAGLCLLHAAESPLNNDVVDPAEAPYGQVQDRLIERLKQRLACVIPDNCVNRKQFCVDVIAGHAGDQLPKLAEKNSIDLVVAGAREHGPFGKMILGSTTESLLRRSHCPVLSVPVDYLHRWVAEKTETTGF